MSVIKSVVFGCEGNYCVFGVPISFAKSGDLDPPSGFVGKIARSITNFTSRALMIAVQGYAHHFFHQCGHAWAYQTLTKQTPTVHIFTDGFFCRGEFLLNPASKLSSLSLRIVRAAGPLTNGLFCCGKLWASAALNEILPDPILLMIETSVVLSMASELLCGCPKEFSVDGEDSAQESDAEPIPDPPRPSDLRRPPLCDHEPIHITANDTNLAAAQEFHERPLLQKSCHIGFGGWHNLDIMALRRSKYALFCNWNKGYRILMEQTIDALKRAQTRDMFIAQMSTSIDPPSLCPKLANGELVPVISELRNELKRKGSWLCSDESFQHIQKLAQGNCIRILTADICDTKVFQTVAAEYSHQKIPIDTLYLGNASQYIDNEEKEAFIATVRALAGDQTHIIHCPITEKFEKEKRAASLYAHQTAVFGKDLIAEELFLRRSA